MILMYTTDFLFNCPNRVLFSRYGDGVILSEYIVMCVVVNCVCCCPIQLLDNAGCRIVLQNEHFFADFQCHICRCCWFNLNMHVLYTADASPVSLDVRRQFIQALGYCMELLTLCQVLQTKCVSVLRNESLTFDDVHNQRIVM